MNLTCQLAGALSGDGSDAKVEIRVDKKSVQNFLATMRHYVKILYKCPC